MASSDLPYVQASGRRERSNPVFPVGIVEWTNRSGAVAQAEVAFELLAAVDESVSNRVLLHVGTDGSGSLWINFLGGDAAPNAPGSIELRPGDEVDITTRAAVSGYGTIVDLPYTAMEG